MWVLTEHNVRGKLIKKKLISLHSTFKILKMYVEVCSIAKASFFQDSSFVVPSRVLVNAVRKE